MGAPHDVPIGIAERFRVDPDSGCWLWQRSLQSGGYAQIRCNGRSTLVHRMLYELLVGPIPEGLQIDHLCRVRHCVNPLHLEPVTQQENIRRGNAGYNAAKTACPRGHPYAGTNLYQFSDGRRACRECMRDYYPGRRKHI